MQKALLTLDEAAEALSLGRTTLRSLIRNGEIDAIRVGAAVRVPAIEIERWIADRISDLKRESPG